ncbi:MAG: hypothetical protein ACO1RA_02115 [Planctomycetaceae bacterium]
MNYAPKRRAKDSGKQPASGSSPAATEESPVYLPTASPPKKNRVMLIISAVFLGGWLVALAYLALTAGHFRH